MAKAKLTDVRKELEAAIAHQEKHLEGLTGSDNPHTVAARNQTEHQLQAFRAVLDRLNGDRIAIKIYA